MQVLESDKKIMFQQIGANVAYYRTLRNLIQDELARSIHVNKSAIGRVERGTYNQNVSIALPLDIADDCTLSWLFS